ncbi:MAG: MATE family efflux transporter, partial [bacterium]|nr:MATE family efflux transporter [bacterium]
MLKLFQHQQREKIVRLLSIMLPIIGTQVAIIGMNFFDASMSGQAGDADLAGAAIGGNLWMPLQTGINGVLLAGMPLIAHLLGAGEKEKIKIIVRHGLLLGMFFALLVVLGGFAFAPMILASMGLEADVEYVATYYLAGIGLGVLP